MEIAKRALTTRDPALYSKKCRRFGGVSLELIQHSITTDQSFCLI